MSDTYDDLLTETPDDSVATCSSSFPSTSDEDGSRPSSEDESETDAQKNVLLNSSVVVDAQDCSDNINYKAQTSYCWKYVPMFLGVVSLVLGLLAAHIDIYEIILSERMKMKPGLPPYDQWETPEPVVTARIFIFAAENAAAFQNGSDSILKLKEIGPIVYREHLHHSNVEFHDNSTLSYTPKRWLEFLPDQNEEGILNRTITVPNFVLLASASSLNNANFIKKIGFNAFAKRSHESVFLNLTVYQYLWNYTSPVLRKIKTLFPFMVPVDNSGVLYQMYENSYDRYNVLIGPKHENNEFFNIATINGSTNVPGFNTRRGDCSASIVNSTEGALYNTKLTHSSVLWYWRKALCRQVPLYFAEEIQKDSLLTYKYELQPNVYDRLNNTEEEDCFKGVFHPLPDGLTDVSRCFYDVPLAASSPHFYGRKPAKLSDRIAGLHPNKYDHGSYIIVEPTMGIPIDQCARSQSNVITPLFTGFSDDIRLFSEMSIPTFWIEFRLKELTAEITNLLVFTIHVLPVLINVITVVLLLGGFCIIIITVNKYFWKRALYMGVPSNEHVNNKNTLQGGINAGMIFAHTTLNETEKTASPTIFQHLK